MAAGSHRDKYDLRPNVFRSLFKKYAITFIRVVFNAAFSVRLNPHLDR
jgi:hypothetical protein